MGLEARAPPCVGVRVVSGRGLGTQCTWCVKACAPGLGPEQMRLGKAVVSGSGGPPSSAPWPPSFLRGRLLSRRLYGLFGGPRDLSVEWLSRLHAGVDKACELPECLPHQPSLTTPRAQQACPALGERAPETVCLEGPERLRSLALVPSKKPQTEVRGRPPSLQPLSDQVSQHRMFWLVFL